MSLWCSLFLWQFFLALTMQNEFQYVMGPDRYEITIFPKPEKGARWQDPDFHTSITRVTDKRIDRYRGSKMVNIYSTVNIETADGKYVLLGDFDVFLYDLKTFKLIKKLRLIHDASDPEVRPDPSDPNIIYYLAHTILYKYDLRNDRSIKVHNFRREYPKATYVQTETQGDPSADGRYWAFEIGTWRQGRGTIIFDIVVYDKQTDTIVSRFSDHWRRENARWVSMSPSGERVLVKMWRDDFLKRARTRLISFDRNFQNPVAIRGANGHADKAVTLDGRDVMFYQHTNDDWISMAYVETGQVINLIKIDFTQGSTGFHFSGNNYAKPGWGLVSTYGYTRDWQNKQLYLIELKENPRVWRLGHTRSRPNPNKKKDYWAEAFATISRSGTKVWWASNWGYYKSRFDVYQITLPTNWWEDLSGGL